jgi:hypothetical protein
LLARLVDWANAWPLSSVGIPGASPTALDPVLEHPSLRVVYADRIIARKDLARLNDPRACEAVLRAIGLHAELAPEVLQAAQALTEHDADRRAKLPAALALSGSPGSPEGGLPRYD